MLNPKVLEAIGRALKAHYDDLIHAPLPENSSSCWIDWRRRRRGKAAMPPASFKDELVAEITNLRAFAISLSGSASLADDLVQETLLRAWSNSDKFHARNEPARVAIHHPAQRLLFPLPKARSRSSRHRRRLFGTASGRGRPGKSSRPRGFSQGAGQAPGGTARSDSRTARPARVRGTSRRSRSLFRPKAERWKRNGDRATTSGSCTRARSVVLGCSATACRRIGTTFGSGKGET